MPVQVLINTNDLRRVRRWLNRLTPSDSFRAIAAAGESVTRRRINAGGPDPQGNPWKKLNPAYANSKHSNQGILKRDGFLLASIESDATSDGARWGSDLIYAAVHQEGRTIRPKAGNGLLSFLLGNRRVFAKSVTIPARPFLGFGAEEQESVVDALRNWLNESTRGYA